MKDFRYIQQKLGSCIDDINIEYYPTIGSTNDYLLEKNIIHKYHFCYADKQTKARGRRGSKWISENNDNVYSTLAFHCNFSIATDLLRSVKVALGVLAAIKKHVSTEQHQHLKIKLPNDIYFKDKKLAGILIETKNIKKNSFDVVIGIGINVNMTSMDENIDRDWTSLSIINNKSLNSSEVIIELVKSIINNFDKEDHDALLEFSNCDYTLGKRIEFNYIDKVCQGIANGVSKDLKLLLLDENNKAQEFELVNISKLRVIPILT